MGADFPLLSNEILLPNLVFFRSLLEGSSKTELLAVSTTITSMFPRFCL